MPNNHHLVAGQSAAFYRAVELMKESGRVQFTLPPDMPVGAGPEMAAPPEMGATVMDFFALIAPKIVCLAFACETVLKALLIQLAKLPDPMLPPASGSKLTHDLDALFALVPADMQARIKAAMGDHADEFDAKIVADAKAFVRWRYLYERRSTSADEEFLEALYLAARREVAPP